MSAWTLVPSLAKLRDEFNQIAPDRAKGADGSIGDTAHAGGGTSDHLPDEDYPALRDKDADSRNEVHALDVTTDLREPGLSMEMVVQHLLARCRLPRGDPNRETRLRYIIFNRRIWHVDEKWVQHTYVGTADPHTGHAHFSASYDSKNEADTASWHLEDIPVALTAADKAWIADQIGAAIVENQKAVAALTTFTAYASGGGKGAPAGRAVLDSGFPLTSGAPRTPTWENLQKLYEKLLDVQDALQLLADRPAA